jgi:hypothetical protein
MLLLLSKTKIETKVDEKVNQRFGQKEIKPKK